MTEKLQAFADLLHAHYLLDLIARYPTLAKDPKESAVSIREGKKYARVDVGTSGKHMVDLKTEEIFGIKAYGVIHRGHAYGTLDTIADWEWGHFHAVRKRPTLAP